MNINGFAKVCRPEGSPVGFEPMTPGHAWPWITRYSQYLKRLGHQDQETCVDNQTNCEHFVYILRTSYEGNP